MDSILDEIKWKLNKYNQEHLLNGYDNLPENKQRALLNEIQGIDFELIDNLYKNKKKEIDLSNDKIEPIEYVDKLKLIICCS